MNLQSLIAKTIMTEREINLPEGANLRSVKRIIEDACDKMGLKMKMKSSLASYPQSVHWHFAKGKVRGTLEITFWKQRRRLWCSVQAGRTGDWTMTAMETLRKTVEHALVK